MILRDGVSNAEIKVSSETQKLSEFVTDKSKSKIDRLESFEDIINIEVGDTGLHRAKTGAGIRYKATLHKIRR